MWKRFLVVATFAITSSFANIAAAKSVLGHLAVGTFANCVLDSGSGKVTCWGNNWMGSAGNGTQSPISGPVEAKLPEKAVYVAGGDHKFCAIGQSGKVYCWGSTFNFAFSAADKKKLVMKCPENDFSKKKGFGTPCAPTPLPVDGISKAASLVMSGSTACALNKSGAATCWGMNESTEYKVKGGPTLSVAKMAGLVQASGNRASMNVPPSGCGVNGDGQVICWSPAFKGEYNALPGVKDAVSAWSAGLDGIYVVHKSGKVSFQGPGMKKEGALKSLPRNGQNSNVTSDKMVDVPELKGYTQITETPRYGCGLTGAGKAACWGERSEPLFGYSPKGGNATTPVEVPGVANAVAVGMGHNHGCALLGDGTVSCWGENKSGQLGSTSAKSGPAVKVPGVKVKI